MEWPTVCLKNFHPLPSWQHPQYHSENEPYFVHFLWPMDHLASILSPFCSWLYRFTSYSSHCLSYSCQCLLYSCCCLSYCYPRPSHYPHPSPSHSGICPVASPRYRSFQGKGLTIWLGVALPTFERAYGLGKGQRAGAYSQKVWVSNEDPGYHCQLAGPYVCNTNALSAGMQ